MKTTNFEQLKSMLKSMSYSIFNRIGSLETTIKPPHKPPFMQYVTDADGSAKWEERTHYHEHIESMEEILPETTPIEDDETLYITGTPFMLEVGSTYRVTYNGTVYECVAFPLEGICLGNGKAIDASLPGNDEPFVVMSSQGYDFSGGSVAGGAYGVIVPFEEADDIKISISRVVVKDELKKIPEKFLPEQKNTNWVVKSTAYDAMFNGEEIPDIAEYYSELKPENIVDMLKNATIGNMMLCFYDKDSAQNRMVNVDDIRISQFNANSYFIIARAETADKSFSITFNAEHNEYDVVTLITA